MPDLIFATTNPDKLVIAQTVCNGFGITVTAARLDIDEIQGEDAEAIIHDKARRAYGALARPLVVSDDSWDIPALNGFPGPYMKSINAWFDAAAVLRLMHGVSDRRVILHQLLTYYDGAAMHTFWHDIAGVIVDQPRGENDRSPTMEVIALDGDQGMTIAEVFMQEEQVVAERYAARSDAWQALARWYASAAR